MATESAEEAERPAPSTLGADWPTVCRRIVGAQRDLLAAERGIAARTVYDGRGEGGDRTLVIDRRAEDIVFAELEALHADGHEFVAVSEERGEVVFGDPQSAERVVIDPIDGSLNARRTIPSFAVSIAVSSGPSMADVEFAFVHDFGAGETFEARRGEGATLGGEPIEARGPGYGLELVGIEAAKPERILPMVDALQGTAFRIRAIGSIAITLCYVAAGRLDGMVSARPCRSVDAAAAQLVAREAGATVEFQGLDLESASLGLDARYNVAAALDGGMLATLRPVQALAEQPEPSA